MVAAGAQEYGRVLIRDAAHDDRNAGAQQERKTPTVRRSDGELCAGHWNG